MNLYYKLLSIPPDEHPPNHYRLLGLALYESDDEVIVNAHRRQCRFVRTHALAFPRESQQLLNELTEAKVCLCDSARRAEYDQGLRARLESHSGSGVSSSGGSWSSSSALLRSSRAARLHELEDSLSEDDFSAPSWDFASVAAESTAQAIDKAWLVGSGPDAPIRIRAPWVSRRHCRVSCRNSQTYLEDLGSTNGTFVNGRQITGEEPVEATDVITLGRKTRLPWPLPKDCEGADLEVFSIGRSEECDLVLHDASVSSIHAQLIVEGDKMVLEDLASTNGTRVGRLDNVIDRCEIEPHLSLFFGTTKVFAQKLIDTVRSKRERP